MGAGASTFSCGVLPNGDDYLAAELARSAGQGGLTAVTVGIFKPLIEAPDLLQDFPQFWLYRGIAPGTARRESFARLCRTAEGFES
jgi:hypothetical protein